MIRSGTIVLTSLPTGNGMYRVSKSRIYKTPKVRKLQQEIHYQIAPLPTDHPYTSYDAFITIYSNFMTKSGKVRRIDLSNIFKPIEDGICSALGIDDSLCFNLSLSKIHADDKHRIDYIFKFYPQKP